jgi:LysR family hydrogen peroxide-inducible transcriptional activator
MEVHQLRYFCAVAESGNFTRAARLAHVAQPSLSQQIIKLEAELGARLFDRLPKSVRLTAFGKAFLPKARTILRQIGEAKTEIHEMAGLEKGEIKVGVIPTIAPYFLPPLLSGFARAHPAIVINVTEEVTSVLLERLHEGRIDLAVLTLPVPGEELICQPLLSEPLYAVLPQRHPLASRASLALQEIGDEPFLLLKEGHCFRENTISACRRSRLTPNVIFESGQFATILAMVAGGMGISIVPRMARQKVEGCRFVPLEGERNQRKIGTVRLRSHFSSRAQQAFLEYLRQAAQDQRSNGAPLFEIGANARAEIRGSGKRNRVAAAS